jgi:hypothetical protein
MIGVLNTAGAQSNKQKKTEDAFAAAEKDSTNYNIAKPADEPFTNPENKIQAEKLKLNEYRYSIQHEQKVYDLQYYTSMIIFAIVIFIVLTGLYLSYRQFEFNHEMLRHQVNNKKAVVVQGADATTTITDKSATESSESDISLSGSTTFEVSKDGIKINSAVIGLIILAISIAFFFLYLEFVYPVNVIKR